MWKQNFSATSSSSDTSFQKDLIVWKLSPVEMYFKFILYVSEGLNSVETENAERAMALHIIVSEGLNSVETKCGSMMLGQTIPVSEGLNSVETGNIAFHWCLNIYSFRRT